MITLLVLEILLRKFTQEKNSRFQEEYFTTLGIRMQWSLSGGHSMVYLPLCSLENNEQASLTQV